jgi:hypothetical protein
LTPRLAATTLSSGEEARPHEVLISSVCAVTMAIVSAVAFLPALAFGTRRRLAAFLVLGTAVSLSPLLVPLDATAARTLCTGFAVVLLFKMWDLHVGAMRGQQTSLGDGLAFYVNVFFLVSRKHGLERQPTRARNARDLSLGLLGVVTTCTVSWWLLGSDWTGVPFPVEHGLKAPVFFLFAVAFFQTCVAFTRLIGGYVVTFSDMPLVARTPAEFWRRYNRLVGQFLYEDVFKLRQGGRHAVLATLGAFLVSGLIHEYLFSMVIGRVQGYQMVFFLLQGCAVALTLGVKPIGGRAIAWRLGTLAFNLASSVFFFASAQSVFQFYRNGLPAWLCSR